MKEKIKKVKSDITKIANKLSDDDILGPVAYLEECLENLDAAIEELDLYFEDEKD